MNFILAKYVVPVNPDLHLKDPLSTELGQKILNEGISLINEVGFEEFNFKKLGLRIQTTEASIYRYFENKHQLLLYLTAWYWGFMDFRLVLKTANLTEAEEKLKIAMSEIANLDRSFQHEIINQHELFLVMIAEAPKSYLVKNVDLLNQNGAYVNYKKCVHKLADMVTEIKPSYPYPHMLISTAIEGLYHQYFVQSHLPSLSDHVSDDNSIMDYFYQLIIHQTTI